MLEYLLHITTGSSDRSDRPASI